ncbi:hypothetical protein [Paraburkholderia sp. BCC1886]|uniref:hypothetical protein n=1 Tax=Paraburkholderia sp. BCC1886 TaxID=2562670 RepID=UPI0011821195|nr:hypothetical protein [Paraburkholderia sp. BCC1886]
MAIIGLVLFGIYLFLGPLVLRTHRGFSAELLADEGASLIVFFLVLIWPVTYFCCWLYRLWCWTTHDGWGR